MSDILFQCIECGNKRTVRNGVDGIICGDCGGKLDAKGYVNCKWPTEREPLLIIELQNETAVPKVFYQGKEITGKVNVSFDWDTDTEHMGGLSYAIEHAVTGEGHPVVKRIERRVKGHAVY